MRVTVITLPGNTERRTEAARQLNLASVDFEFFDAICAEDVARRCPFDAFDESEFLVNTGRYMSNTEVGCFASHRALWKQAETLGEPIVIMEDDFHLHDNFAAALCNADLLIERTGYLRLQSDLRARKRLLGTCNGFSLCRYTKAPHGSMCYCISPPVAKRFLELTRTMNAPVDVFIKKFWEHGQPLYALTPYPVCASHQSVISTISRPPKQRKPLPVAARRVLRKTGWHVRRFIFNRRQQPPLAAVEFQLPRTEAAIQPDSPVRLGRQPHGAAAGRSRAEH